MLVLHPPTESQEAPRCFPVTCSDVNRFCVLCTKAHLKAGFSGFNKSKMTLASLYLTGAKKRFLLSLVFNHNTLLSTWHFFWWGVNSLEYSWWWGTHTNLRIAFSSHTRYPSTFTKRQPAFILLSNQTDFFLALFFPRACITRLMSDYCRDHRCPLFCAYLAKLRLLAVS